MPADNADLEQELVPCVKSYFIGRDGTESSNLVLEEDPIRNLFQDAGAIQPPASMDELLTIYEMSGPLRTNIDAYAANVDGQGYCFDEVTDFDAEETREVIRQAIIEERIRQRQQPDTSQKSSGIYQDLEKVLKFFSPGPATDNELDGAEDVNTEVSESEIDSTLKELKQLAILEKAKLAQFYEFCCVDRAFTELRMHTRNDIEIFGNAYWEVLRNQSGEVVQFNYVQAQTVRLMPVDSKATATRMLVHRNLLYSEHEIIHRRFRRYVQINPELGVNKISVYYKEFGDPRTVSALTGKYYRDLDALRKDEGKDAYAATEMIHFKIHSTRGPYGIPRWLCEHPAVLGSRYAEDINLAYFENKSIPPMAILVSGGRLAASDIQRLRDYIHNEIRGKKNFHKILILQAEPAGVNFGANLGMNNGNVKIEIKPLTQAMEHDGQFMNYLDQNTDRIGSVFRLPRLLRGDIRDFNKSSAESALDFTEHQVFSHLRKEFDWVMNRMILPSLGVRLLRFRTKGAESAGLEEVGAVLNAAARAGYLSVNEARSIASKLFNHDLKISQDEEAMRPMELKRWELTEDELEAKYGWNKEDGFIETPDDAEAEDASEDSPKSEAQRKALFKYRAWKALNLIELQEHFRKEAVAKAQANFSDAKSLVAGDANGVEQSPTE